MTKVMVQNLLINDYCGKSSSIILSAITLTLSCLINKRRVLIGIILIVAAIIHIYLLGFFGYLSGILILVAGIIALVRK